MRLTHALRPEGIHWPTHENGDASFKLTDLTAANDIQQVGAHDALVDVRATIAVARLVKEQQPRLFDYYFELRNKNRVAELINLASPAVLLHVSGMFPASQGCLAPVLPLMMHPGNSNEVICFNLRCNPQELLQLNAEEIHEKLYTKSVDLAHGEQRLPLKGVHLNKSPALAPVSTLSPQQAEKWQINWDEVNSHKQMLQSDSDLIGKLKQVYAIEREFEATDVDSALYEGFIPNSDRLICNQVLAAEPGQLAEWAVNPFKDNRLNKLLFRYRARNFPHSLNEDESVRWQRFCQARLVDGEFGASLTLEQFQQQLLTLGQTETGDREQALLEQLSRWVQHMFG